MTNNEGHSPVDLLPSLVQGITLVIDELVDGLFDFELVLEDLAMHLHQLLLFALDTVNQVSGPIHGGEASITHFSIMFNTFGLIFFF